jgi:uncharacterized protein YbjT (DUF2867 family)
MDDSPKPHRVLLLGATGNRGSRLLPALLAHHHTVVAMVRSQAKLATIMAPYGSTRVPTPIPNLTIIEGDATDSSAIRRALLDHDCDTIADVAGNQVAPWKDPVLERIVRAVVDAAVAVGRERGRPLRAWIIGGLSSLGYPGMEGYLIQD